MTCEHLRDLEETMSAAGLRETFRGSAWSANCREWVYFDCFIDVGAVRWRHKLADCVHDHAHRGTHDGQERGFVCTECNDALIGSYEPVAGRPIFSG